jgi:osmotically-inducible protein OsmY
MKAIILPSLLFMSCMSCSHVGGPSSDERASVTTITAATVETRDTRDTRESDRQLVRRIERAIAADPALSDEAAAVEVDAVDGAVALYGAVATPETKAALVRIAEGSGHVVLDKLLLSPSAAEARGDETIAWKLQRAMLDDPAIAQEMEGVSIDVARGAVVVRGRVSSAALRTAVETLIANKPGVLEVKNDLAVR